MEAQPHTPAGRKARKFAVMGNPRTLHAWARHKADEWYKEDYVVTPALFLRDHGTDDDTFPTCDYVYRDAGDPYSKGISVTLPNEDTLFPVWRNMLMRHASQFTTWHEGEREEFIDDALEDFRQALADDARRRIDDAIEDEIEGPDPERYRDDN